MLVRTRANILAAVVVFGPLAACASPSTRIATALQRYGLDRDRATCVGDRLQASLSLGQLEQLGRVAKAFNPDGSPPHRPTAGDLLRASAQINDPRVPIEVASATAACGVLTGVAVSVPS